ncbi:F-box/LRR-repeat protein 8 [Salvelinus fontinalis]|uniref:F-box/LRR-repeat protein 8 n=1 Tax=Salvelinus fontinalis TaxID=8038 RepID=UPI002485DEAD|nr:F-box/LRR-repeat protein 8 [Salvelinus fontinalis]
MEFPEEVLAHIFSYLSVKERDSASAVCRRWSQSMSHPRVWRYTEIRCETGEQEDPALQHFSSLLPLVRHLKITVSSLSDPANRSAALSVLRLATSGPLRTLILSCSGGVPLFYSGHDLEEGLEAALTAAPEHVGGAFLSHLDLRGVPFTLSQSLVRVLARQSPNLRSLLVNNQTLVCKVEPEAVVEVLGLCPLLNTLGLFYTSLSQKVVDELLLPQRCPLLAMELYCERFAKYIPSLEDSVWAGLKHRHPGLKVSLILDHTLPMDHFSSVLQPSVPLQHLELLTFTDLVQQTHLVTQSYSHALETIILQTTSSPELDAALRSLAAACSLLREVHCYCVVSCDVIRTFKDCCPLLWRYTLKTRKEPHPWRCTVIK